MKWSYVSAEMEPWADVDGEEAERHETTVARERDIELALDLAPEHCHGIVAAGVNGKRRVRGTAGVRYSARGRRRGRGR